MLTFAEINGCRVKASDRGLADWILSYAQAQRRMI